MSELAARARRRSSSASGLADRLVELGLLVATTTPRDRRQVVVTHHPEAAALLERFRELNQRRSCASCCRASTPDELEVVDRASRVLGRRHGRRTATARRHRSRHRRKGIPREPLCPASPSPSAASRCSSPAPCSSPDLGVGKPPAGAPARHRVPGRDGHRAVSRAPARPTSPTRSPSRSSAPSPACRGSRSLQSTSANSVALVVAQFSFGTDVKATVAAIKDNLRRRGLPASVEPNVSALNINASPVIIASIAANDRRRPGRCRRDRPDRDRPRGQRPRGRRPRRPDRRPRGPAARHASTRPSWPRPVSASSRSTASSTRTT